MTSANDKRLFWASFLTLIAAGMGFSVRAAGMLREWGKQFGFTQSELGDITGFGLVGFGITIIAFSFVADRIGFGPLMVLAFALHVTSAIVTLLATPAFDAAGKAGAYWCLSIGGLLFSLANGTCEAVINPLTATLSPREKTHWLNILHAGWPGGLVLGSLVSLGLAGVRWEIQWGMFLIPTLIYGVLMLGRTFPTSEAAASGATLKTMLLEFLSPILVCLLLLHAMVGYVELGTDSWISNITANIFGSVHGGTLLLIWTSSLMFGLRFFAGPIVHKISPLGLLLASAVLACAGLLFIGRSNTALLCVAAATIYGVGKTFFWPTMLGVVSERYPKGGALTLGMIGGVGMLSAGILGGPGIGYKQDYFATEQLQATDAAAYQRYKSDDTKSFLFFPPVAGLDGSKVATLLGDPGQNNGKGKLLAQDIANLEKSGRKLADDKNLDKLNTWWQTAKAQAGKDEESVGEAVLYGGRMALIWTAAVPAVMALGYLLLILWFRTQGGYQQVHIESEADQKKGLAGEILAGDSAALGKDGSEAVQAPSPIQPPQV